MRSKCLLAMAGFVVFLSVAPTVFAAEQGYFAKLGATFSRGVRNVVSSPYEIPYTIGKYDGKNDGNPRVFRDVAGFFDGVFRTVTRFGSGAWDIAWAFIPGDQEGLPLEPETFF